MRLIVGLGNPGKDYSANRHNIGFFCLNHLAKINHVSFDKKQGHARVGSGTIANQNVVLAKPQTFMNLSGLAVSSLMHRYQIALDDLVIVHDDLDLPLGKIRIRKGSSAGGHNGIKSIISSLGSQDFTRVKVGISHPEQPDQDKNQSIVDYVLGDFTAEEKALVEKIIPRVGEAVVCLLTEGLTAAMNKFN